jgi:O-antigen ligase
MDASAQIPSRPANPESAFWGLFDFGLCVLIVMVAADMLTQLGAIQSLVWLICYAGVLLRIGLSWPYFFDLMSRNVVVLAYPLVCLASVLWSRDPSGSLAGAIQLTMTALIAMFLGWRYSLTVLLKLLFFALMAGVLLSLLHWATGIFPWRVYGDAGGLLGIFRQKNMLGQKAVYGVVAAIAIILLPATRASARLKLIALISLPIIVFAIVLSKSMTSVVLIPPAAGLLLLLCLHRIPKRVAFGALSVLILLTALGPLGLAFAGTDPLSLVLDATGKDITLTGRTLIWQVGGSIVAEYPILGIGYLAFWVSPEFAPEQMLVHHAGAITTPSFHNFVLEILVGCGVPGLLAMLALLWVVARRLFLVYAMDGSVSAAAGLSMLSLVIVMSLVGASLFRQHEMMILLTMALCTSAGEDIHRAR